MLSKKYNNYKYSLIFNSFNLLSFENFYFKEFFDFYIYIDQKSLNTSSFSSFLKLIFLKNLNNIRFDVVAIKINFNILSNLFFFNDFVFNLKALNFFSFFSFFFSFLFRIFNLLNNFIFFFLNKKYDFTTIIKETKTN